MYLEKVCTVYVLFVFVLICIKFGIYDFIREIIYDKNKILLKNRKYVFFSGALYYATFKYIDEITSRKVMTFSWVLSFFITGLILFRNI